MHNQHLSIPPAQLAVLSYAKHLSTREKTYLDQIDLALSPLRTKLKHHPLYSLMKNERNVKVFMNAHVYCVWDFMNLVKRLQMHFTSVQLPWRPTSDFDSRVFRRLINEIVLEEESDELGNEFISHFSFYIESIRQIQNGSISEQLTKFIRDISNGSVSYNEIVNREYIPFSMRKFLRSTKEIATHENILVVASAFTFGREVMLPEIFTSILQKGAIATNPNLSKFVHYLHRHIELDGDYHGYLAKKIVLKLATTEKDLDVVIVTAKHALEARVELWDQIYKQLSNDKPENSLHTTYYLSLK